MNRRTFIAGLGSAAAGPIAARAQQGERVRRIGLLDVGNEKDPERKGWFSALTRALAELGWVDGRNMQVEVRWAGENFDRIRVLAKELVDRQPDLILATGDPATAALQRETRSIPIVLLIGSDPVGDGLIVSPARPGGNITGFIHFEAAMAGKLLELLTQIAPDINRIAFLFNPDTGPYAKSYYLPAFEAASRSLKVTLLEAPVRNDAEIKTAITSLGREPGGGLVMVDAFAFVHRAQIISLAARNGVPGVYPWKEAAREGGLISYAPDILDEFRRAAPYVDRILRGAKPADLPVQLPVKFEMVLNARTAKTLGLSVPQSILLRADEVIE
jgi:putative ABC transport system substrate-binding protein